MGSLTVAPPGKPKCNKTRYAYSGASQVAPGVKNLPANTGRHKRQEFKPWIGKILCRRAWQPTPVFLPGESYGQRSLVGYSPQGGKESNTTEVTEYAHTHACTDRNMCFIWEIHEIQKLSLKSENSSHIISLTNTDFKLHKAGIVSVFLTIWNPEPSINAIIISNVKDKYMCINSFYTMNCQKTGTF